MNTPLQQAAQALMDALGKTDFTCRLGEQLDACEKALDAELQQSVEPVAWVHRFADKGNSILSYTKTCAGFPPRDDASQITPLYLHPPQHTRPVKPVTANDDDVICPSCCHQFRAIPVGVQQLMLDAGFEPPFKHPPQQLRECWYESDDLKVCRKCGQLHDKAIPPQQAKQVPLSDDEIDAIMQPLTQNTQYSWRAFARAIEAHHGIGGEK